MSSGNTYGLGEIQHFGAFQRVGGKAAGFINKKFFHPSSLRNQEKLWLAQTEDEREQRKQAELEKRRDEERQVEELRKQMYLSGQGKASDMGLGASLKDTPAVRLSGSQKSEQKVLLDEQKQRRAILKSQHLTREHEQASDGEGGSSDDDEDLGDTGERVFARSRYDEDVHVRGHSSVWGSWYSSDEKQWGFACCKSQDFSKECPLKPEEREEETTKAPRGRKRRRRGKEAEQEPEQPQGGLQGKASAASSAAAKSGEDGPLIDERMLQAAERRQEQRKMEERKKEEAKTSGYLADLLADPTSS